jgi:hypothetical protein
MERPRVDQKIADRARPRHGTEFGDTKMGRCAFPTCQKMIVRADAFIVTQAGDLYHTACWQLVKPRRSGK